VLVVNGCFNFRIGVDSLLSQRNLYIGDETSSPPS
jgi:hypothetical protein